MCSASFLSHLLTNYELLYSKLLWTCYSTFFLCSSAGCRILKVSHSPWGHTYQSVAADNVRDLLSSHTIAVTNWISWWCLASGSETKIYLGITIQRIHWSLACILRLNCNFWKKPRFLGVWLFILTVQVSPGLLYVQVLIGGGSLRCCAAQKNLFGLGSQHEACSVGTGWTDQEARQNLMPVPQGWDVYWHGWNILTQYGPSSFPTCFRGLCTRVCGLVVREGIRGAGRRERWSLGSLFRKDR